jgi:transcriptional regulator
MISKEIKKGSTETLVLALLEDEPRHGYEIGKLIEHRSDGVLQYHVASLYPILYRLEKRRWIRGKWETGKGGRRRRYYELTALGRRVLGRHRASWRSFINAMEGVAGIRNA